MPGRFTDFCGYFDDRFKTTTRSCARQAHQYLSGLVQGPTKKKNMERMTEKVADSDYEGMQHFLTDSPWDERGVLDQVAQKANLVLPRSGERFLAIDESAFAKKGNESAGVARQWDGRRGKVDNCQIGVFATLGAGAHEALIDARLYLPHVWAKDTARCKKARIPVEQRSCVPKHIMALEMVRRARDIGLEFDWVAADGGYGHNGAFLQGLDEMNETYMVDVHSDQRAYLQHPDPRTPPPGPRGGIRAAIPAPGVLAIEVRKIAAEASFESWQSVDVRSTTKGVLKRRFLRLAVWVWDGGDIPPRASTLLVREDLEADGTRKLKYSLSNAPANTTTKRLALMQAQRFWIEDTFHNGKGAVGMADYQARQWTSWHHHMALVAMALLFLLEERLLHRQKIPLLSCNDIVELLAWQLPRKDKSLKELTKQMTRRHQQRQASIDSAIRCQSKSHNVLFTNNENLPK